MVKLLVSIDTSPKWAEDNRHWVEESLKHGRYIFCDLRVEILGLGTKVFCSEHRIAERRVKGTWASRWEHYARRNDTDRRGITWKRTYGPGYNRPFDFYKPLIPMYWNYSD